MGQLHGGEWFIAFLALRLGDMMHPDPSDLGFLEDGLEFVAKEDTDLALVAEITAEVAEEWIGHDDIELGFVDEPAGVGEELVTGTNGFGAEVEVLLKDSDVADAHVESFDHPAERLGEIALVVLGLNDPDLEWLHRLYPEEVEAEAPADDDLHHEAGLPDTGTTADDHGGAAGEPAFADQVVGIVVGIKVDEVFDRDHRGLVVIGLAGGEVVLP